MNNRSILKLCRVFLAGLSLCGGSAWALDPTKPPGGNFDLTHWYLGLPVDSSGGTNGDSASISASQLVGGYTSYWFYTATNDGAMTFWAPVTGATTSGSSYPRSELREQIAPPSNNSNWLAYGTHVLNAQCKVMQVPSSLKVIIGQIHGFTGAALPLVKVQYNNGKIEALIKTNSTDDGSDFKFTYATVGLSNTVNYQIYVSNGLVAVTVNGLTQSMNVFVTDTNWATNTLYYKAGSYCQDNVGTTNEGARLAFYSVSTAHAPAINSQPRGVTTNAGNPVTLSVAASGNGVIKYQWKLGGTTNVAGATNASLSFVNVQATNAGSYSVVVSDALGSATSAVAILNVTQPPTITSQPSNQLVTLGGAANFNVTASGSGLRYQWYLNTNSPVPSPAGTNATLTLTNVQTNAAGTYFVIVSNASGSTPSSNATLTVNSPPVPGTHVVATGRNISLQITAASLVAVASDPDGDSLSVTAAGPLSAHNGGVTLASGLLTYSPPGAYVGGDSFNYTLTDGRGATASGQVLVTVVSSNTIALTTAGSSALINNALQTSFTGVPNLTYTVDRATNVSGPWELGYTNLTADTNGLFQLTAPFNQSDPEYFYRTRYP